MLQHIFCTPNINEELNKYLLLDYLKYLLTNLFGT